MYKIPDVWGGRESGYLVTLDMSGFLSLKVNRTVYKHCTLVDKVVSYEITG